MNQPRIPWCETCNRQAFALATRYGERCTCPVCGRWSWQRKPLADRATHEARKAAHAAFDPLWQRKHGGLLSRGGAYRLLQAELGLTPDECHMAIMDAATALCVPAAVASIRAGLDGGTVVLGHFPVAPLRLVASR